MTTKIKTTLLTGLFFFGLLTGLQAQDKYEFALIHFLLLVGVSFFHTNQLSCSKVVGEKKHQPLDLQL